MSVDLYKYDEEYRDTIATVDEKGNRIWVYPKKPKGNFHKWRVVVSVVLLTIFFAGPFIRVDGHEFMLINVFQRKFIIFGIPIWPQDFHILALAMIAFVVFIVLFTTVFGRIWCGWACPQTVFMEMVFRKIEYWIEGDANQQRRLNAAPWTGQKIFKKTSKQIIFVLISLLISHTVMAYLIGVGGVIDVVSQPPSEHLAGFIGLMVFTGIFYFIFSWFREQACIAVCPYGRLQGVFLGNHSIAVIYDWVRGEPRGRVRKATEEREEKGDCIDCKMCVHVCPTGIDIRNGTQLECVNCTACIDACDDIMERVNKPKGLIKYASHIGISEGDHKIWTPRVAGYSVVLTLLLSIIVFMLGTRTDIEATVLRVPGMLYQEQENNRVSNLYNITFINKTFRDITLEMEVDGIPDADIRMVGEGEIFIPSNASLNGVFFIEIPKEYISKSKTQLRLRLISDGELMDVVKTNFLGPVSVTK
ncbi:MAG: cytochrome c oxidase accessory protein CcoG [Cyclobacteriaceae bacterium]|nr:cytochrome c oxidase accessory protein CcoG [Cyclobacteriaceae bacterium]